MTFATDKEPQGQFGKESKPKPATMGVGLRLDQLLGLPEDRSVQRANRRCWTRWRPQRAVEWAGWTWTLLWRIAVILGVGAAGGVFGSLLAPRMGVVLGGLAATAAGP
jgi:hypothetical protein